MVTYSKHSIDTTLTRRRFLHCCVTVATSLCATTTVARVMVQRTLSFVHTHTNEKLTITYAVNGQYQPASLDQINHLLRDFRNGEAHTIDPKLLDILFDLQMLTKHDGAFQIISAYRSPTTNAQLRSKSSGVAEHSMHMEGRAIDVRLDGFSTLKLRDLAMSLRRGGVGYYAASDFVHIDTGRVRYW